MSTDALWISSFRKKKKEKVEKQKWGLITCGRVADHSTNGAGPLTYKYVWSPYCLCSIKTYSAQRPSESSWWKKHINSEKGTVPIVHIQDQQTKINHIFIHLQWLWRNWNFKKQYYLKISSKKMKCLGINLTKEVQNLYGKETTKHWWKKSKKAHLERNTAHGLVNSTQQQCQFSLNWSKDVIQFPSKSH